jgi:hypothetical protein
MLTKLQKLAEIEGFEDYLDLLDKYAIDSVCPGICSNTDCEYTTEVEPDQDKGWCEECNQGTVTSAMVLAGVI